MPQVFVTLATRLQRHKPPHRRDDFDGKVYACCPRGRAGLAAAGMRIGSAAGRVPRQRADRRISGAEAPYVRQTWGGVRADVDPAVQHPAHELHGIHGLRDVAALDPATAETREQVVLRLRFHALGDGLQPELVRDRDSAQEVDGPSGS